MLPSHPPRRLQEAGQEGALVSAEGGGLGQGRRGGARGGQ